MTGGGFKVQKANLSEKIQALPKIENEIHKTITFHITKCYEGDGLLVFQQE